MSVEDPLTRFWRRALGDVGTAPFVLTHGGRYLEKHGQNFVFLFADLDTGQQVLLAAPELCAGFDEGGWPTASAAELCPLNPAYKLEFRDLDYVLPEHVNLPARSPTVGPLSIADRQSVDEFLASLSEDDVDTLDLDLAQDHAFAVRANGKIVGIARFSAVAENPELADITVAVCSTARGAGVGKALVTEALHALRKLGLTVKYRVREDNRESRAIAERLGLRARWRLVTWSTQG